jgi:hypothetical protein
MEFSPFVIVSSVAMVASRGAMILNLSATPFASRIGLTYLISSASWARVSSSQKIASQPSAFCRSMARFTQSTIGSLLAEAERQMSPFSTLCSCSTCRHRGSSARCPAGISKVVGWEPYSSAFCAIRPIFCTVPAVAGSSFPFFLKNSIVAS